MSDTFSTVFYKILSCYVSMSMTNWQALKNYFIQVMYCFPTIQALKEIHYSFAGFQRAAMTF